jgi:cellulose synthase/poly-beta-1,6-N-acetylglucosamine synthase-like glycosyltransferase
VTEDMEIVMRLHRHYRRLGRPYRIVFGPDPICWTEIPSDMQRLRRQRNRWQRGLWETLWRHRSMVFNPRYGKVGTLGLPYFWLFEALSPIVEVLGYVVLPLAFVFGVVSPWFAGLFLLLAILYGILLSELAVGIETMLLSRYPRFRDRLMLMAAAFLEFFGYHQLLAVERFVAMFQIRRKRGIWGQRRRAGFGRHSYKEPFLPTVRSRPAATYLSSGTRRRPSSD